MPGRKTHDYPDGKPLPLFLLNIAGFFLFVLWVIFASGRWFRTPGIIVLIASIIFINAWLHKLYERTGQAVPLLREMTTVKFVSGTPAPLLTLRAGFFVLTAALVVFRIAPVAAATARIGTIGSVISLFLTGFLSVALERYYVHKGRGQDVPVDLSRHKSAHQN
jgi:hypothetical protein